MGAAVRVRTWSGAASRHDADDEAGRRQGRATISGNVIAAADTGVWVEDSAMVEISGNQITNGGTGVYLDRSWECCISGNQIDTHSYCGIYVLNYGEVIDTNHLIESNHVSRCDYQGIFVWYADEVAIIGNYVLENNQSDSNEPNIELATCDRAFVADNVVKQGELTYRPTYGIVINGGTDCIIIDNDVADGGATGAISDTGTRTVWGNMQSVRTNLTGDFTHNNSGNWVSVEWDGTDHDWGDLWAAGNPTRLTFDVGGLIDFDAELCFEPDAAGERGIRFRVDGATVIAQKLIDARGAGDDTYLTLSTKKKIGPGSYVEVQVYQDSGGNLNVQGGGNYTPHVAAAAIGQP